MSFGRSQVATATTPATATSRLYRPPCCSSQARFLMSVGGSGLIFPSSVLASPGGGTFEGELIDPTLIGFGSCALSQAAAEVTPNVRAKPLAAAGRLARAADDEPRRSHGQGALPWTVGA